jgi:hypothetical protein
VIDQAAATLAQEEVYRCAPDVLWIRDAGRVFLIAPQRGQTWALAELEAAIWDWAVLDYGTLEIVRLISLILKTSPEQARKRLDATLRRWVDAGLIEAAGATCRSGEN